MNRRRFVDIFLGVSLTGTILSFLYPVIRYILPSRRIEVIAFSAVCTHLTCNVLYESDTETIFCPCHNGRFDLSGNVLSGPPPAPLESYTVEISGKEIIVSRKK